MIYFVEAPSEKLIKIGYVGRNPDSRFSSLQVGSPVKLSRLALLGGARDRESKIHAKFREHRSHGEWFRDSAEIREFIGRHGSPWVGRLDETALGDEEKAELAAIDAADDRMARDALEGVRQPWGNTRGEKLRLAAALRRRGVILPEKKKPQAERKNSFDIKKLRERLDAGSSRVPKPDPIP